MEQLSSNQAWDGTFLKFKVASSPALGGLATQFAVYLPPGASQTSSSKKVPVLYYLAGLTCNEDTGAQKGGFLRDAAKHGLALVFPDTSPRGAGIEGEEADWVSDSLAFKAACKACIATTSTSTYTTYALTWSVPVRVHALHVVSLRYEQWHKRDAGGNRLYRQPRRQTHTDGLETAPASVHSLPQDFGTAAGFYLNATNDKWKKFYNM